MPASSFTGALRGIVWIDKNLNQLQDSDEPGLPFTPMIATLVTSSVGGTPGTKINFTTDRLGKYLIPKLEPGKWDVSATLQSDALAKTFDTDDGVGTQSVRSLSLSNVRTAGVNKAAVIDWEAKASVPVNGLGVADFAAAGDAALKLQIDIPAECVKSEKVEITWAGLDLRMNTNDDATFVVKVVNQEAAAKQIPYGSYTITPLCTSGVKLTEQTVSLKKLQVVTASVKPKVLSKSLPATGQQNMYRFVEIATLLMVAGVALARRRRRLYSHR